MLSYWVMYVSRPLLKQHRCLDILFLLDLYEQQNNHFVFLVLILMNRYLLLSCNLYSVSKQEEMSSKKEEMSSLTCRSNPSLFAQRPRVKPIKSVKPKVCKA